MRHSGIGRLLLLVALAAGCTTGDAPSGPAIPPGLAIAVEIDGEPAATIDTARLQAAPPDYVDEHRRAWRLATLLGDTYAPTSMTLEVEQRDGTRTVFTRPTDAPGREPTLLLNRNGELLVALLDTREPFPPFHGRGGNRGRAGDPDRIRHVARLRLSTTGTPPSVPPPR